MKIYKCDGCGEQQEASCGTTISSYRIATIEAGSRVSGWRFELCEVCLRKMDENFKAILAHISSYADPRKD